MKSKTLLLSLIVFSLLGRLERRQVRQKLWRLICPALNATMTPH